jgi:predicted alpha/beta-fold hydrolase
MFLKTALVFSFLLFATDRAYSASFVDFSHFETKDMRILSPSECHVAYEKANFSKKYSVPNIADALNNLAEPQKPLGLIGWVPTGAPSRLEPSDCDPKELEYDMLRARKSATKQAGLIGEYFKRCDSRLRQDATADALALLGLVGAYYDGCENPNIRRVLIRIPGGEILRGVLALKADSTPRPLVILKCGLFCNGTDLSHALAFMHLYDESPFNVLAIANGASADFARDNGHLSLGGFEEGRQLIQVIKMVRSGPLAARTSSIHLMGISLGSHASLYASYMAPFNTAANEIPVASALATCPVVDLKESIHGLFAPSFKGKIAEQILAGELTKVIDIVPMLKDIMPSSANGDLPERIALTSVAHLQTANVFPAPFQNSSVHNTDDFWRVNNYLGLLGNGAITTPTLLMAADDDAVVSANANTGMLMSALSYYRTNAPSLVENGNLAAVRIPAGNHCAFSITYGWRSLSALYRGYILSHSPEMLKRRKIRTINIPVDAYALPINKNAHLWDSESHRLTSYGFEKGKASFQVKFQAFQGFNAECSEQGIPQANLSCFRTAILEIPFAKISNRPSWASRAPLTDAEAQALTRWANSHLNVLDAQGNSIVDTHADGAKLTWETYDND